MLHHLSETAEYFTTAPWGARLPLEDGNGPHGTGFCDPLDGLLITLSLAIP